MVIIYSFLHFYTALIFFNVGRCLFPATGYLELVWVTFAMMKGSVHHVINVEFEDIQFLRATAITPDVDVELTIMVHYGNGSFEVSEGSTSIVTGTIREIENCSLSELPPLNNSDYPVLGTEDFYKELRLRGYNYTDAFQNVLEARSDGLYGKIKWDMNWVSFMDCILQIGILSRDTRTLMLPTRIQKFRINAKEHMTWSGQLDPTNQHFDVYMNSDLNIIQCGGVEIIGMVTNSVSRRKAPGELVLESYSFIPYLPIDKLSQSDAIRATVQIIVENHQSSVIKAVEVASENTSVIVTQIDEIINEMPQITSKLTILSDKEMEYPNIKVQNVELSSQTNCLIVIASNCLWNTKFIELSHKSLVEGGFLIAREPLSNRYVEPPSGYLVISNIPTETESIVLLRKTKRTIKGVPVIVDITQSSDWLAQIQKSIKVEPIIVFAQNDQFSGIIGLVNCIRKEPESKMITCVFVDDAAAPPFNNDHPFYSHQLNLGLAINVYRKVSVNYK